MKIIEISGFLENGIWSYGLPFPEVEIKPIATIDQDGVSAHSITLTTNSGTYLETSAHLFKGEETIDQVPSEKLITEAVVIKLAEKKAREHITVEELEKSQVNVKEGDALLIHTGWDSMWNKEGFVEGSPHFTRESIEWILEKKISILGADLPCYDDPQRESLTRGLSLLGEVFKNKILILAPVVNLGQVSKKRVKLIALPLRVKGKNLSAAPCRALVIED